MTGLAAAAVGGAFWMAFLAGVAMATITGLAYAELITEYPQAAVGRPRRRRVAGVLAMTGFENAANVAEETVDPSRAFPRAPISGMLTAGGKVHRAVQGPTELHWTTGQHFDFYDNPAKVAEAADAVSDFFQRHLTR